MGQERIIHAALLGAGTVGSGVYKLVKDLEEEIISKTGARLVVDKILVRDRRFGQYFGCSHCLFKAGFRYWLEITH